MQFCCVDQMFEDNANFRGVSQENWAPLAKLHLFSFSDENSGSLPSKPCMLGVPCSAPLGFKTTEGGITHLFVELAIVE